MTPILDRIHSHGGKVIRDKWRTRLRPGRMPKEAIAWVAKNRARLNREVWPESDDFEERAAIREFDGGMTRAEAEAAAYAEVMGRA